MNICFFSIVTYWHGLKGGMDLHGKHLLEGLSRKGHEVIVISSKHPSLKDYEEINGIRFHYLKETTFGSSRNAWKRESIRAFTDILKTRKVDLVVSQSKAGYSVANLARNNGIPFITIMHGYETMIFFSILNQVINFRKGHLNILKALFSCFYYSTFQEWPTLMNSSAIIAVSDKVAKAIQRRPFIDRKKIKIIKYGIDLEIFQGSDEERKNIRKFLNFSEQDQVVLFLSLLSKQKGADVAIRAFKELSRKEKNVKLIIGGDGDYLQAAKQLAEQLGMADRVVFPGFIPNDEASGYYNAADIFIFPTLRLESFGIVLAEAMACEKPIIASKIGSIPDVIDDGINGILVRPGDHEELSREIRRLLRDREYSRILAKNARKKALQEFSLKKMVEDTIEFLGSALKT